jgi:arylsulfatase A-like enzyme
MAPAMPVLALTSVHTLAAALAALLIVTQLPCVVSAEPEQPAEPGQRSYLLFVVDTVRADAVSSWGEVAGTTPTIDRLAAEGLRFSRTYSNAPWTLPSHASLFTGLDSRLHGVNWNATRARDALVTVAERFRDAGFETVGLAENPWLAQGFNVSQGFEHFVLLGPKLRRFEGALAQWLRERDAGRPFFLFVNVVDAHAPYLVRDENPFLPPGVGDDEARAVSQKEADYMCRTGRTRELEILRGLYLGGVHAADRKLTYLLTVLEALGLTNDLVTVVASDHGEHFGERARIGHVAGLDDPVIHVPLVVHGLPGVAPAVVDADVDIARVAPSLVSWAGLAALPGVEREPLPLVAGSTSSPVVAEWYDPIGGGHAKDPVEFTKVHRMMSRQQRAGCKPADRVHGDQRTLIRYPWKLTWYEKHPPELHDLREKSSPLRDVSQQHPDLTAELLAELNERVAKAPAVMELPSSEPSSPGELPDEVRERLRALGYLE